MITVVDYGMANVGSVVNMLKKIGQSVTVSAKPVEIARAEKLILPGVGSFDSAMYRLEELKLLDPLNELALSKKVPVLGICLGMQILLEGSEEGERAGFGWIEGKSKRFVFSSDDSQLKVPHMGWNKVCIVKDSSYFSGAESEQRFYFVHSYFVECSHEEDILAVTDYGGRFAAAIQRENIVGVQFHPEKSHRFGMRLLSDFSEL